jgi:DNA polymerase-1
MRWLAFDCETDLIRPGVLAPPLVCVSVATPPTVEDVPRLGDEDAQVLEPQTNPQEVALYRWDDPSVPALFRGALEHGVVLVGANVAYDMAVVCAAIPDLVPVVFALYDRGLVRDVQIDQKLLDNAVGELHGYQNPETEEYVSHRYSLAALAERLLDIRLEKGADTWRLRYAELRDVPLAEWPAEASQYALDDARTTANVFAVQRIWHYLLRDADAQARAAFALHLASCWGVHTDGRTIDALETELRATLERVTAGLVEAGLVRPDGSRDTKAAKARMLADCRARGVAPKLTAGAITLGLERARRAGETPAPWAGPGEPGSPHNHLSAAEVEAGACLDDEACREAHDPLLEAYAERTSTMGLLEQHVPALRRGSSGIPIQPRYDPLVGTGRTSCKGPDLKAANPSQYGYQIQNPRRQYGVREAFAARPGRVILDVDYDQGELRCVAEICFRLFGFSHLGDALNRGEDVHLRLGAKIVGLSYEEALANRKRKDVSEARQLAKAPNFGFPGGMGPWGMVRFARASYGLRLTLHRAKELRDEWLGEWQEFRPYFAHVRAILDAGGGQAGTVEHLISRRLRGACAYTVACNSLFQGLLADIAKDALYRATRECLTDRNSPLYGCRPWGFIHDQILADAPVEVAHEAAYRLRDVMVEAANAYLLHVPMTAEPVVSTCWSKEAEKLVGPDGRLVPWSPAVFRLEAARRAGDARELVDAWARLEPAQRAALEAAGRAPA